MLGSRTLAVLLLAACASLGFVVAERMNELDTEAVRATRIAARPVPPGVAEAPPVAERPPELPPLAALTETVERPLFSETRRPEEIVETPEPPPPELVLNVMLTGVVIDGDKRIATIRVPEEPRVRLLSEGDSISSWRIDSILPDRVIMSAGERIEHVLLRKPEPDGPEAKPSSKPRRPTATKPGRAERLLRRGRPVPRRRRE